MRTGNINVQAVIAQAQAKLSATDQQTASSTSTSDAEKIGKISPALAAAHQRIAAQSQTASASLSALGKFKSDLFNLGTAAKALSALPTTSTLQTVQSALDKLVSSYNASLTSGAAVNSAGADAGTGIGGAQRALRNAFDGAGADSAGLKKLGVSRQQDGSLALDASVLAKAFSGDAAAAVAALATMAERIADTSTSTLSADSRLSTTLTRLGSRAQALKDQQAAVVSTATQLSELQTANNWSAMALAAYRKA